MAAKPATRGSPKAAKPKEKKTEEKPQRKRFIEVAREVGVDETGKEFERLFQRVVPPKTRK
jgi:hypothetical protein